MSKPGKLDWHFKDSLEASRQSIYALLYNGKYNLDSLLEEVTGAQLWIMVNIFRGTKYWRDFLIALLNIPPTAWEERELMPENARESFTAEEKKLIRELHADMLTDGKHSPILQLM